MDLRCLIDEDPRRFRDAVRAHLEEDPVVNTVSLSLLGDAVAAVLEPSVLARVVSRDGDVVATGIQSAPHNLIVTTTASDALRALAAGLAESGVRLPGVTAVDPWAHEFAETWSRLAGVAAVDNLAERLFRLDAVVPPQRASGQARLAAYDDMDVLVAWTREFEAEAGLPISEDPASSVGRRISRGRVLVWHDVGGPTSYCMRTPVIAGTARIGPVYTPPSHRGRGYASNLVSHASAGILAQGAVPLLFADLANPTSNGIYQAIGYRPVADAFMIDFI